MTVDEIMRDYFEKVNNTEIKQRIKKELELIDDILVKIYDCGYDLHGFNYKLNQRERYVFRLKRRTDKTTIPPQSMEFTKTLLDNNGYKYQIRNSIRERGLIFLIYLKDTLMYSL